MEHRDSQTYAIIGAAMEVHRVLGNGFLAPVYQDALALEFDERGIAFSQHLPLAIDYKGQTLSATYCADFICFENVLVAVTAIGTVTGDEQAQVINQLKAANIETALLINFGQPRLQYRRLMRSGKQD